jgi:hypothetical protein
VSLPSSFDRFERKPPEEKPAAERRQEWRKVAVGRPSFLFVNRSWKNS